jgi:hypothetical protein
VTDIAKLEADANAKRSRLEHTLRTLEERATVLGLVDDIIARSGAPTSAEIIQTLRRNPLLVAGLALCVGLIAIEAMRARKRLSLNDRHRPGSSQARGSITSSPMKEEISHGT